MQRFERILLSGIPTAGAEISGNEQHSGLRGTLMLYPAEDGSVAVIEVHGLPENEPFLAVHLHNGASCAESGSHLSFELLGHPLHTGDFPPLLNNEGFAWSAFYTDRFTPHQAVGYPVVIHAHSEDFRSQPAGDPGEKIACGMVRLIKQHTPQAKAQAISSEVILK